MAAAPTVQGAEVTAAAAAARIAGEAVHTAVEVRATAAEEATAEEGVAADTAALAEDNN